MNQNNAIKIIYVLNKKTKVFILYSTITLSTEYMKNYILANSILMLNRINSQIHFQKWEKMV